MQQLVHDRLIALGISQREAAQRSNGLITNSTLSRILSGVSAGPWSLKTLRGLSLALDVPMSTVEKIAGTPTAGPEFRVPPEWELLNAKQRKVVYDLVNALLKAHRPDGP